MGITSPQGIFLSIVFWSLFVSFSYFTYMELSKILARLEATKINMEKSLMVQINETVLVNVRTAKHRQEEAFGLFKKYWNNSSSVEHLVKYVRGKV